MIKVKKLVSDDIEGMLNKAIQHESTNTQIYLGMYSWLVCNGFNNAGEVMLKWANEETGHSDKVKEYIDDRNAKIIIPALEKPVNEFKSIVEVMTIIFNREVATEDLYKVLQTKALREGDHPTHEFATWFISEQKEEIVKIRKLIDYANLIGELNPNLPYFMDKEFKELL